MQMKRVLLLCFIAMLPLSGISTACNISSGHPSDDEPEYYSFEDLRSAVENEYFYFDNQLKPGNALVLLDTYLQYPLCSEKNAYIIQCRATSTEAGAGTGNGTGNGTGSGSIVIVPPSNIGGSGPGYHLFSGQEQANWNDAEEIKLNWNTISNTTSRGDLIFTRSNSKAGNFVKFFSNWTHVAIIDNPSNSNVFEATPDNGVSTNNASSSWSNITYYTCKAIQSISYDDINTLLDSGKSKYSGLPYFPKALVTKGLLVWLYEWSDKDNLSSMYCSKLVYNVFKPFIDLDSGGTSVLNPALQNKSWTANAFKWIGVSPDDIYYSSSLGPDFSYSSNMTTL